MSKKSVIAGMPIRHAGRSFRIRIRCCQVLLCSDDAEEAVDMIGHDLLVDPRQLLLVRFLGADEAERKLVALICAYVLAHGDDGTARVAVEIIVDSAIQKPIVAYYCDPQRLERYLIPPRYLREVRPYVARDDVATADR